MTGRVFAIGFAALLLAGCSATAPVQNTGTGGPAQDSTSRVASTLFGQPQAPTPDALAPDVCPRIEVRDGSAVWREGSDNPTEVRYQATITDLARECRIDGSSLVIKVGIEGRVLVGPRGGAGQVRLPIRIAVTRGLSDAVWTRLYTVPITIPASAPSVDFTQVEEQVVIALPAPSEIGRMIIFVGFDSQARPAAPERGRRAAR